MSYSTGTKSGANLSSKGREPVDGNTTIVCDAWPVRHQTYSYLPTLSRYQIYAAWWQLTAQDINPIAHVPEFAWPNFTSRSGAIACCISWCAKDCDTMCAVLHHWCVMAFRDRVIHLLAVRAYKRPELILRLQNGMYVACCSSTMSLCHKK